MGEVISEVRTAEVYCLKEEEEEEENSGRGCGGSYSGGQQQRCTVRNNSTLEVRVWIGGSGCDGGFVDGEGLHVGGMDWCVVVVVLW